MSNDQLSPLEQSAIALFYQANKVKLDYAGYCQVIQQTGDLYLQLLSDYLERVPNETLATHANVVGTLMLEIQQML